LANLKFLYQGKKIIKISIFTCPVWYGENKTDALQIPTFPLVLLQKTLVRMLGRIYGIFRRLIHVLNWLLFFYMVKKKVSRMFFSLLSIAHTSAQCLQVLGKDENVYKWTVLLDCGKIGKVNRFIMCADCVIYSSGVFSLGCLASHIGQLSGSRVYKCLRWLAIYKMSPRMIGSCTVPVARVM